MNCVRIPLGIFMGQANRGQEKSGKVRGATKTREVPLRLSERTE